jgi:hypothetical protein
MHKNASFSLKKVVILGSFTSCIKINIHIQRIQNITVCFKKLPPPQWIDL